MASPGPAAWIVDVDPEQPNYPAVASRILSNGTMESNPLWRQEPPLSDEVQKAASRYLSNAT
jgi:acetolactate synthase-1/2/3 large subunit